MVTRRNRYGVDKIEQDRIKAGAENSSVPCARCKNLIWKGRGFYYKKQGRPEWIAFCREDCAEIHLGWVRAQKLLSYEQYMSHLITGAKHGSV